jgi:Sec-independent protein secretion pathway component TatC
MVGLKTLIGGNREENIACFGLFALIAVAAIGAFTSPMGTQTSLMVTVGAAVLFTVAFLLGAKYERAQ